MGITNVLLSSEFSADPTIDMFWRIVSLGFVLFCLISFTTSHVVSKTDQAKCRAARSCFRKLTGKVGENVAMLMIDPVFRYGTAIPETTAPDNKKSKTNFDGLSWEVGKRKLSLVLSPDEDKPDNEVRRHCIKLIARFPIPIRSRLRILPGNEETGSWYISTKDGFSEFSKEGMSLVPDFDKAFYLELRYGEREDVLNVLTCDVQKIFLDYAKSIAHYSKTKTIREINITENEISITTEILTRMSDYSHLLDFEKKLSHCIMETVKSLTDQDPPPAE